MIKEILSVLQRNPYVDNPYLVSLLVLVFAAILAKVLLFIFNRYLMRLAKKTKSTIDDLLFDRTKKPIFYLILTLGLQVATLNLGVNGNVTMIINSLLAIVFLFIISRTLDVIIEAWGIRMAKKTKSNIDDVLLPLFHKAVKVVMVIVAIMWVLKIWGIDITPYLAGVGLSGLVLGLALQDSLKNVFGGVTMIVDKNFNIGDPIRLETGELGTVKEIGLRSTKMLTYDNELIFIPNGQLANMRIRNYLKPNDKVRKKVHFGVAYGTKREKVEKVVLGALKGLKGIEKDPKPDVLFVSMGDSALNFEARFWVVWDDAYGKFIEATDLIYTALNKAKIDIPFPSRTIYMKK